MKENGDRLGLILILLPSLMVDKKGLVDILSAALFTFRKRCCVQ